MKSPLSKITLTANCVLKGEFLPSLKSMDTKDLVIFLGTMSKIFAPGLRIGWVCSTNAEVLGKYNFIKQGADLQSSTIDQLITNQFLEDNDLDAHVEKIKAVYVKRRDAMLKTMEETFPKEVKFTHPEVVCSHGAYCPNTWTQRLLRLSVWKRTLLTFPAAASSLTAVRKTTSV